jgi:hypothetical protein
VKHDKNHKMDVNNDLRANEGRETKALNSKPITPRSSSEAKFIKEIRTSKLALNQRLSFAPCYKRFSYTLAICLRFLLIILNVHQNRVQQFFEVSKYELL